MASPLIPNTSPSFHRPELGQIAKDDNNADWEYWNRVGRFAVQFASATVDPAWTAEQRVAYLRSVYNETESWLRAEPTP